MLVYLLNLRSSINPKSPRILLICSLNFQEVETSVLENARTEAVCVILIQSFYTYVLWYCFKLHNLVHLVYFKTPTSLSAQRTCPLQINEGVSLFFQEQSMYIS